MLTAQRGWRGGGAHVLSAKTSTQRVEYPYNTSALIHEPPQVERDKISLLLIDYILHFEVKSSKTSAVSTTV